MKIEHQEIKITPWLPDPPVRSFYILSVTTHKDSGKDYITGGVCSEFLAKRQKILYTGEPEKFWFL